MCEEFDLTEQGGGGSGVVWNDFEEHWAWPVRFMLNVSSIYLFIMPYRYSAQLAAAGKLLRETPSAVYNECSGEWVPGEGCRYNSRRRPLWGTSISEDSFLYMRYVWPCFRTYALTTTNAVYVHICIPVVTHDNMANTLVRSHVNANGICVRTHKRAHATHTQHSQHLLLRPHYDKKQHLAFVGNVWVRLM